MKQRTKLFLFHIMVCGCMAAAHADEQLPSLVVTADRTPVDAAAVSADVTVIDEEEIEKSQATTVAELLRRQAGIDVTSSGGAGTATSVFIRGGNSGHTLVLIDGVRMGSATVGSFDWGNLSTADVERIEIVRGPQSSLYGADAMGGVVQVFTRRGKGAPALRIHGEGGSYGTAAGHMSVSGTTAAGTGYALSAEGLRTRGVSAAANGTEPDPYHRTTLSGHLSMAIGLGELEIVARHADGTSSVDGGFPFGDVLNYTMRTAQSVASTKVSYPLTDRLESSLQLSRSFDRQVGRDPAGGFNNSDFLTRIDQLTWQNRLEWRQLSLLAGLDMHYDHGSSGSAGLERTMRQAGLFASLAWHGEMADANASLRHDRNSVTIDKTTYKFGLAVRPWTGWKLSANYGTGFKAPALNDLYFPGSGNPNLRPEESRGWDTGLHYERSGDKWRFGFGAIWFHQSYRDLIAWAPIAPGSFIWIPSNVNRALNKGLELTADARFGAAYLQANWTLLDAKDRNLGTWLNRRARESGNLLAGIDVGALNAEAALAIVGPRFSGTGNTQPMAGYRKLDLRARYAVNDNWQLTARVENVGDKRYEEVSGYGVPGRAWYLGLSADL